MTFSDKLIALRKKAGWSQEELAERLNVSRQSVSKWESAQSMPDIDKILQLSSLFSVTTDCLLKDTQDDTQPAAAQTPSPLPRVTLTQAEDYLTKAQANAPQMALATALCIVSPIPLLALGTVRELGLLGLDDDLAGGLGMIALLVLVACGVYAFVRVGTVQDAMDRLLEDGDFTRGHKAVKGRLTALTAAYWLVVVAIFLWYTFGPNGNGQPQYSWFIWAIAGVVYAACVVAAKAFVRKKV